MMNLSEIRNRRGERLDLSYHPSRREDCLVILAHGVTGNKDRPLLLAVAEGLAERGWPCLRMSFSGNGDSEGDFGEATVTKESEDLLDLLDQLPKGKKVAYCGHSMGGAVGLMTVARAPQIELLVTLAGMLRTGDFYEQEFGDVSPGNGCMWEDQAFPISQGFADDMESIGDLLDEAGELGMPYLMIHGSADDVVSPEDSADAYEAAEEPKRLLEIAGAEHSFGEQSYAEVIVAIDEWLIKYLG